MEDSRNIVERINSGVPLFLFLGQRILALETGQDPLLQIARNRLTDLHADATYSDLFLHPEVSTNEDFLGWLSHQASVLPTPASMSVISRLPWSGVFTSSIDGSLNQVLRTPWRDVQPLYDNSLYPLHPRSRTRLNLYHLYGAIDRVEASQRVPLSDFELAERQLVAGQLLARLADQITPLGILLIDGFGSKDWLQTQQLFAVLSRFSGAQAFFFSVDSALASDRFIEELRKRGIASLHQQSLASVLSRLFEEGAIRQTSVEGSAGAAVFVGGRLTTIPKEIYLRISNAAEVLDSTTLEAPPELSRDGVYAAFRAFLGDSSSTPVWQAHARGLSFVRDFQRDALALARRLTSTRSIENPTILLHGQSGTGKTVALSWIAYEIAKARELPVLFCSSSSRPNHNDLDEFCRWAEDGGATNTVIVWDGMQPPDSYVELRRLLSGRGRNVLILGSAYRQGGESTRAVRKIEAPASLTSDEQSRFRIYLRAIDPDFGDLIERLPRDPDDTFLVTLYRLLPETRYQLRAGLSKEASLTEEEIVRRTRGAFEESRIPALAIALAKANVIDPDSLTRKFRAEVDQSSARMVDDMVGLVLLPGRLGLRVPFDLMLRAADFKKSTTVFKVFEGLDLFRWREDSSGAIFIGPRHRLEAQLLSQTRLGGPMSEIACAKRLIGAARRNPAEGIDVDADFIAHLVQGLGPNGPEGDRYWRFYQDVSTSLTELRNNQSLEDSRLMLQEATLLREWARKKSQADPSDQSVIDSVLEQAEKVLVAALELSERARALARHRSNILVELASVVGTGAHRAAHAGEAPELLKRRFDRARQYALRARALDPGHYYPIDVILWVARDILGNANLPQSIWAELAADALEASDLIDPDELDPRNAERFRELQYSLANELGNVNLAESAFTALAQAGSAAGYYLKAQIMLAHAFQDLGTQINIDTVVAAMEYLQEHRVVVEKDARCMRLWFRCWWASKTRQLPFAGERQGLPFSKEDIKYGLHLIDVILSFGESSKDLQFRYLKAVLLWQLGEFVKAADLWKELQRDTDFSMGARRVIKSHISTDSEGHSIEYQGVVQFINRAGTRGRILLERNRQAVDFFPMDFGLPTVEKGQAVGPFHIAFNFIAPVADPTRHVSTR